jgi:hypothetical protein
MINSYFTYHHLLLLDLLDKTVLVIADLLSFFGVCVCSANSWKRSFYMACTRLAFGKFKIICQDLSENSLSPIGDTKRAVPENGEYPSLWLFKRGEWSTNYHLIINIDQLINNWWSNDDQLSTINYETSGDSWSYPKRGGWCQTDQVSNLEIPDFQRKTIETYAQFSALIQKRMRGICIPLPNISG